MAGLRSPNHDVAELADLATYTPKQVAQLLNALEWWIRDQATYHRIPHLRLGRAKIVFRRCDIEELQRIIAISVKEPVVFDPRLDPPAADDMMAIALAAGVSRRAALRLARTE